MRWIFGSTIGSLVTVLVITFLTIVADLEPRLKDGLKEAFGHHWVGKGIIALIVFVVVTMIASAITKNTTRERTVKAINTLVAITVLAAITLLVFFLFETFY